MRIGVIEISPTGHNTFVETLIRIYSAVPENEIFLFCNARNMKMLGKKEIGKAVVILQKEEDPLAMFLSRINDYRLDKAFIVTLEAVSDITYQISRVFYDTNFYFPVYLLIHNADQWFPVNPLARARHVFFHSFKVKEIAFRVKLYYLYPALNGKIIRRILSGGGKIVVLSEPIKKELQRRHAPAPIIVIPFSVYEENLSSPVISSKSSIRVCIPGSLSGVRRNYDAVFDAMENNPELKGLIQWDLLGWTAKTEGGGNILSRAKALIQEGYLINVYPEGGLGMDEFDENLSKADLILCNLNLQINLLSRYGITKESGIPFAMIKAAKPGILPVGYEVDQTLESSIIRFKDYREVGDILKSLLENPDALIQLKETARKNSKKYAPLGVYRKIEKIENP